MVNDPIQGILKGIHLPLIFLIHFAGRIYQFYRVIYQPSFITLQFAVAP